MSSAATDFVIVGAGQNQLSAAAYLAKAGHGVTVLERHDYWGGGCITKEVTAPGFKHDTHATNIFMARANPMVRLDELALISTFGLQFAAVDSASHGTVFADGSAIALYKDLERSCASIAKFSQCDAAAYDQFVKALLKYTPLFSFALFNPPANGHLFKTLLGQSAEGRYLLQFFESSMLELINRHFSHERVKIHLLRLGTEMMMRVDAPGSAFGLMFMVGLYHTYPPGFIVGGSQNFSNSLIRCIRHHGGSVITGADVNHIDITQGRASAVLTRDGRRFPATRAVIAGLPPWELSTYVHGTQELTDKVLRVPNSDYTCFLAHLALKAPPQNRSSEAEFQTMAFTVMAPPDLAGTLRMVNDASDGRIPVDFSATYVSATHYDKSRAPANQATLYLYQPVPTLLADRPLEAWDQLKHSVGESLVAGTRNFLHNLTPEDILGCNYQSPLDTQRESPSFRNGDVAGLAMTAAQFLSGRPIPELADYRVPGIDGLYLCGPFMHPGGGANGGGRPVAMRVMIDLGMRIDGVFQI